MSLPNYITFIRIFISPIFFLLYMQYETFGISFKVLPYILLFLLAISELSDAFDGYIARKTNQVSDLGKILDPMADSIYRISIFLTFTQGIIQLPMLLVFVFIYRDAVLSTLRTICALRGFALAASMSGKIKAILQAVVAFFILILFAFYTTNKISLHALQLASIWSVSIACVYTFYSAIEYIWVNKEHVRRILTSRA